MGKKKPAPPPPLPDTPDFLLDLDTVYVRTSKTQLKIQPKPELINEPPSMNMTMGLDPLTGKQLFKVHYKKPLIPPVMVDASVGTVRPEVLYVKPATILARYSTLRDEEDSMMPMMIRQEGKYVVDDEPKIVKYDQIRLDDSDDSFNLDDESDDILL